MLLLAENKAGAMQASLAVGMRLAEDRLALGASCWFLWEESPELLVLLVPQEKNTSRFL